MATVSKWTPFDVALDITATGGTVTRKSATQYTVKINTSWETYYNGAKTNFGMTASSGGGSVNLNTFGTKSSSGSGSFTGTYSISGNGSASKTITVTFKNYEEDWQGNVTQSKTKTVSFNVTVPALTSYAVKYNANGGSGAPSSQTKWKDQALTLSSTKPTRSGYTFKGWATSASGSVAYTSGASYTNNASVTLYAVWQANTYTVKYNANGGTGAPSNQTKTHGVTLTLSSTKPTRASVDSGDGVLTTYTFKGWATSANTSTVSYAAGAKYTSNTSVTLYAVWSTATTITEYDVTYNTNGGSNVSSQVKKKGVALTLRSTVPTKSGYTFSGWGLSEDTTTVTYTAGASYTKDADIVLYAVWTPWTHTVKYNLNGGTGTVPASFTKTSDVDVMIQEGSISKADHVFKCWSTKADGTGSENYYIGDAYTRNKNGGTINLYAIWKDRKILIYPETKVCKANEFIEGSDFFGFGNDATVNATEFIEGNTISFGSSNFVFGEIIEK